MRSTPPVPAGLKFVDELPPKAKRGRPNKASKFEATFLALVQNAGKWATLRTYPITKKGQACAYAYAKNVKSGNLKWLSPANGIECAVRRTDKNYIVFVRFVAPTPIVADTFEELVLDGLDFLV